MTRAAGAADYEVLLIDGNNLLHRMSGGVEEPAQHGLFARLRAALSPTVTTIFVLDGHPPLGSPRRVKIGPALEVRHAGNADTALIGLIEEQAFAARAATVLVTDDRALSERARSLGAQTRRLDWLVRLVGMPRVAGIGRASRPTGPASRSSGPADSHEADEREPWRPGRGATRKSGNPRRSPRRR